MAAVQKYEDLDAYQLSRELRDAIFRLTEVGPTPRNVKFRDQIRRSSSSSPANIAEGFKASFERHQRSVELAEPVLRKYKLKLAIENHKGWRAAEHVAWIERLGSEWVGACYDFGNNMALCEDPAETLRLLAPVTIYVSFKDMAVAPYDDGFLLSEMALGEGMLDIPGMVKVLQQKDPNMIFALEMITRDPLKIPVFTKKYWATFDDTYSPLPGGTSHGFSKSSLRRRRRRSQQLRGSARRMG